ncbi:threonine ammonia-lyase IlvA [Mesonia aestuariivivens]|uniref:L-threonine dehydratase n=1 Tax=Mesonia aestuariivivens TaxID=2796128 RepID=A0ABS6VZK9_9FLAO|nr:threonine ammonia-lyase IlvA [Mesonia aestuariivivens]MBW2961036.1 threonine ammonia-lyase IlvA [Mesonia aestuariivivens]
MKTKISPQLLLADVKKAQENLEGIAKNTPLELNRSYSKDFDAQIFLKREDQQRVRSYKIRGAYHKIVSLSAEERQQGVVCASAGNHAQGVAYSCKKLDISAKIFMPTPTPLQKVQQVRMFGEDKVEVILIGDTFDDAKLEAMRYSEMHNSTIIHPFDDRKIMEGQGTIALEILTASEEPIDYVFVPIGGGGVASGVSSMFKLLSPHTKIIGVEPKGAASMSTSILNNENTELQLIDKFVDGAAVKKVGELTFQICKQNLEKVVTVDEGKICETILNLYNRDAIVVEPAGALTLAVLEQFAEEIKGKNVVCLISGGNNDITRMEEIKERALLYNGLKHYFLVKFPQRAGALKQFVVDILGPDDDITHFEYIKKNSREKGHAVVGIELKQKEDFDPLLNRMKDFQFYGDYINDKESLMSILI